MAPTAARPASRQPVAGARRPRTRRLAPQTSVTATTTAATLTRTHPLAATPTAKATARGASGTRGQLSVTRRR